MSKAEKIFVYVAMFQLIIMVPCLIFRVRGIIPNEDILNFGMTIGGITIALPLLFLLKQAKNLKHKVGTVIFSIVFFFVGVLPGYLITSFLVGVSVNLMAINEFTKEFTCVKSDKVRSRGIVNWIQDDSGSVYTVDGFEEACGYGAFKEDNRLILYGKRSWYGIKVEKIELIKD